MFLLSACALCAALAAVPASSPSPSPSPIPEIAHVFTADRTEGSLATTSRTVYVVTRDQIARYGYRTISDALIDVPGIVISPLGPLGSSVNFTVRGSSSAQVLVLLDGMPAPGSFSNSVELGNLATTGVERIEVVEGGGSTLYGAGAVGGIINIITQTTSPLAGKLSAGTFAQRSVEISTPALQFSRTLAGNTFALPDGGIRDQDDYQSTTLHLNERAQIGHLQATLRAGTQADHLGAPGPQNSPSLTSRENDVNQNVDLTLNSNSAQAQAALQLGATTQRIYFVCQASDPQCFAPSGELDSEGRFNLSLRDAVRGQRERLSYGVDLSRGVVRQDDGAQNISVEALAQAAFYAQEHLDGRAGSYYAGLRAERDGSLGGQISPSAGAIWRLGATHTLAANLGQAFRAPNAAELYFPNFGNPHLRAERSTVADLTFTQRGARDDFSFGWFGNRTIGLIYSDPVTFALTQAGHALIQGLTLTGHAHVTSALSATLGFTDLYRASNLDTASRLPNDPVFLATMKIDYTSPRPSFITAAGVDVLSSGARAAPQTSLPFFEQTVPFTSVGAYLRLRVAPGVLLTVRGQNLGNERYAAVNGFPMPGRSMLVELATQ